MRTRRGGSGGDGGTDAVEVRKHRGMGKPAGQEPVPLAGPGGFGADRRVGQVVAEAALPDEDAGVTVPADPDTEPTEVGGESVELLDPR